MLQFEELKLRLENLLPDIQDLETAMGLAHLKREAEELDQKAAADGFWDDMETAQKVTQRAASLKSSIEAYEKLVSDYHDTMTLIELANEEQDDSLLEECTTAVDNIAAHRGQCLEQRADRGGSCHPGCRGSDRAECGGRSQRLQLVAEESGQPDQIW